MKMRHFFLVLAVLFTTSSLVHSQEKKSLTDSLYVLLGTQKVYEARDFYEKHKDSLQRDKATSLIYASQMNTYLNKPDSAIRSVRCLLDEFNFSDNRTKLHYLSMLGTLYVGKEDYKKLIEVFDEIEELLHVSEMPDEHRIGLLKDLQEQRELALYQDSLPKKEVIDISNSGRTSVPFTVNPILGCIADFNGIPLRAWVDTGCEYPLLLKKEVADQCRLKDIYSTIDTIFINGISTPVSNAIVDSIRIGEFNFKNMKAVVVHQNSYSTNTDESKKAKMDSIFALQDVMIGLPLLLMLKSLELDLKNNRINLSLHKEKDVVSANMFVNNGKLFTLLSINEVNFMGQIDTGGMLGISIGKSFYEKHYNQLPANTSIEEYTKTLGTFGESKEQRLKVLSIPHVNLESEQVLMRDRDVFVTLGQDFNGFDGIIGYNLLKKLYPRMKLDFENMRISTTKE